MPQFKYFTVSRTKFVLERYDSAFHPLKIPGDGFWWMWCKWDLLCGIVQWKIS